MTFKIIAIGFVVAGLSAPPAFANWFDAIQNGANHKKLIGSTRSPTPDDLRATGDSKRGEGKSYVFDSFSGHYHEVKPEPAKPVTPTPAAAEKAPVPPARP